MRACIAGLVCLGLFGCTNEMVEEYVGSTTTSVVAGTNELDLDWVGAVLVGDELCTGSLIEPNWVLTTATCVGDADATELRFVRDATVPETPMSSIVAQVFLHPSYVPPGPGTAAESDLALLRLVGEDATDAPEILTSAAVLSRGDPIMWVGYGASAADGSGSGTRRSGTDEIDFIDASLILSFGRNGTLPCHGDEGAPALATTDDLIVGLVIAFDAECRTDVALLRLDRYVDWIDATTATTFTSCDPVGGDCDVGSCLPVDDTTSVCYPSEDLAEGASCLPSFGPSWSAGVPCGDGTLCVGEPAGGTCVRLCTRDGDCVPGEVCRAPILSIRDELGVCSTPLPDAGVDAGTDGGVDAGDDAAPTDGGGSTDAGDGGGGGGCGCRAATGSDAIGLLPLALLFWRRQLFWRRRRVTRAATDQVT